MRLLTRSALFLVALGIAALVIALLGISGLPTWAQILVFYVVVFGVVWALSLRRHAPPRGPMLAVVMGALALLLVSGGMGSPWNQVFLTAGLVWFVAGWFVVLRRARKSAGQAPVSN